MYGPYGYRDSLDSNLAKHPQGLGLSEEDQAALLIDVLRHLPSLSVASYAATELAHLTAKP